MAAAKPKLKIVDRPPARKNAATRALPSAQSVPSVTAARTQTSKTLADKADQLAKGDLASSTRRAYTCDWSHFAVWCRDNGHEPLPASAETVRLYLTDHAETYRPATLSRRLVAVCRAHKEAGHEPPTRSEIVRRQFRAICRQEGVAQAQKSAITIEQLRSMTSALPPTLQGVRDRGLLLIGFAGAFRRSELVALNVADVSLAPEGLLITLRRSKTDQTGKGRVIAIPLGTNRETCPVQAYQAWVQAGGITTGPLFRAIDQHGNVSGKRLCDRSVARIVQRSLERVGVDATAYAAHSLRAGLVTEAARRGIPDHKIMAQTGHKSREILDRYKRDSQMFRDNPAGGVGL
jgi:site-specific recombinase XerD